MMVGDIMKYGGPILFAKGLWRYRWMGQTYLPVLHWFDRGLEGMRGEALRASAWHYRAMVCVTINQFMNMFKADANLHGGEHNDAWHHHSPTRRPSGAACSIPGRTNSSTSRWR